MTIPTMTPPLLWIGMMFAAQFSWAQTITVDEFVSFAVEQYQDCADDWDQKTPAAKTATDYAHPGAPIGAILTGIRGSGPERKRFSRFTDCYLGAIEGKRAENEREQELRRTQLLSMCQTYRCESPEWMTRCNALLPDDFPPIQCPSEPKVSVPPVNKPPAPRPRARQSNFLYCNEIPAEDWTDRVCEIDRTGEIRATRIGDS